MPGTGGRPGGGEAAPRVALLSMRGRFRAPGFGCSYEFEDVVAAVDEAVVLATPGDHRGRGARLHRTLREAGGPLGVTLSRRLPHPTALPRVPEGVRLVLLTCPTPYDLALLDRLRDLPADVLVCAYLPEFWPAGITPRDLAACRPRRLDHLFVSMAAGVDALERALACPVTYLPLAADVPTFAPVAGTDGRPIAVMNVGRRSPVVHEALLGHSRQRGWLYHHDAAEVRSVSDFPAHRRILGGLLGLTSVAIVNHAKFDEPATTGGVRELPARFFEALAAGAAMVGAPPAAHLLAGAGVGLEAIVEAAEPHDAAAAIDAVERWFVDGDPARRAGSVAHAAAAHDWLHRWDAMLAAVGLPPAPAPARRDALARLALVPTGVGHAAARDPGHPGGRGRGR